MECVSLLKMIGALGLIRDHLLLQGNCQMKTNKRLTKFGVPLKTENMMKCHGVISSLNANWRTRANNKPLVINRNVKIDALRCN